MDKETSLLPSQVIKNFFRKKEILDLDGVGFTKEFKKRKNQLIKFYLPRNESLLKGFKDLFETDRLKLSTSTDYQIIKKFWIKTFPN